MIFCFVVFLSATPSSAGVGELPVTADYCAIYRALVGTLAPNCPAPNVVATPRSIGTDRGATPPGDPAEERGYFVRFAFNSEALTPAYRAHLDRLKAVMTESGVGDVCLKLVGHTDGVGRVGYNQALSLRRALAVKSYLVGPLGVPEKWLMTEGRGESEILPGLAATDARNRRVEILAKTADDGCQSPE